MAANNGLRLPGSVFPPAAPPSTTPSLAQALAKPVPHDGPVVKDVFREIVETVVFVVVLVFLLKIFVAEAFVIPTGSMAETLLGYQRFVTCPQCKYEFPVNCSQEVDPQDRPPTPVDACTCPNCRFREVWRGRDAGVASKDPPAWGSGDRVLVSKFPYDRDHLDALGRPGRFNVVVFKYPKEPQKGFVPMNYIKRLIGLPGETLAIYNGDVYVSTEVDYPEFNHPRPQRPEDLWQREPTDYTYTSDAAATAAFANGKFTILRKPPEIMLAMRRLVYDNAHQPADLAGKAPPRWQAGPNSRWSPDDAAAPRVFRTDGGGASTEWLRFQNLVVERSNVQPLDAAVNPQPQPIRNFMGYNAGEPGNGRVETNWVGDLMLECTVTVEEKKGELVLELAEGSERFHARFDLATGACSLVRVGPRGDEVLATRENVLTKSGPCDLRFANFDDRLTVWVDGKLPFGEGVEYQSATPDMDHENNLRPANVGVRNGAKLAVTGLNLWRDTFYTVYPDPPGQTQVKTMYVQPGHYLCLGDNSTESADSRSWGLVPERLMLGRALMVYWPAARAGFIR